MTTTDQAKRKSPEVVNPFWTEERMDLLKAAVADGAPYSQIANQIGGGCSKNAAIGKAKRLGLEAPPRPSKPGKPATVKRDRAFRLNVRRPSPLRLAGNGAVFAEPAARRPRAVVPERDEPTGCCNVLTIGAHQCKWPIGDPSSDDFTLCGAKAPNGPYCDEHRQRAYQPARVRTYVDARLLAPVRRRFAA